MQEERARWIDEQLSRLGALLSSFKVENDGFLFEPCASLYRELAVGGEQEISQVAGRLTEHVGLLPIVQVQYEWALKMPPQAAARVSLNAALPLIQVPFSYAGKAYALGAILAHELTHVFMGVSGIATGDPPHNEELTDLTAVCIGYGKLMLNGVWVLHNERRGEATVLGYLSPQLLAYAYRQVIEQRGISGEEASNHLTSRAIALLRGQGL